MSIIIHGRGSGTALCAVPAVRIGGVAELGIGTVCRPTVALNADVCFLVEEVSALPSVGSATEMLRKPAPAVLLMASDISPA